ncbi:hypothetical protein A0J61_10354 [Choanephora cucurbitarum]|uniref:Uncharacterized protein n=1 Tax=Choanephora cucurbitarum TaxID=101091 RepID=A0A1C7MXM5_9FUNG|nr:hypothetical protein A0J61_10354 [Choanephora cucurbitarum]
MTFIGELESKSFVAEGNNVLLKQFLSNNTKLITNQRALSVSDDTWKELYKKTLVEDCLQSKLFSCCMAAFKKEEYEALLEELLNEVMELEAKASKTASDYLTIMSYKLLSGFESLDLVEKSCLKYIVFEDEMMPARIDKTKGMKPQIMYIMWFLLNKFDVWGLKPLKEEEEEEEGKGKEVPTKESLLI